MGLHQGAKIMGVKILPTTYPLSDKCHLQQRIAHGAMGAGVSLRERLWHIER